mgnify:CR=1 FL=1
MGGNVMKKISAKKMIETLSEGLEEISVKHVEWAIEKHKAFIEQNKESYAKKGRRCFKDEKLFSLLQYKGDWQIHRVFQSVICVSNRQTRYEVNEFEEVSQYFFNVKTFEEHYMQRPLSFMGRGWNTFSPMRYRKLVPYSNAEYFANCYGDKIGGSTLHPILRRNGLTNDKVSYFDKKDSDFRFLMKLVAKEPFYETLIKSNQWKLSLYNFSTEEHKKAMLLNLRFGIDISGLSKDDFTLWKDSISLMQEVGIDWHNPKLLADWRHQHDIAVRRKAKLDEIKEMEKIDLLEDDFATSHKKYLGIMFEEGGLFYHALSSVKEYYDEGKAMHHCVYQCRYYLKKDVVIFSIRDAENNRLATLEYDAKRKEIVQCRAVCNKVPERYDDMVQIFKSNEWRLKTRKRQILQNAA